MSNESSIDGKNDKLSKSQKMPTITRKYTRTKMRTRKLGKK